MMKGLAIFFIVLAIICAVLIVYFTVCKVWGVPQTDLREKICDTSYIGILTCLIAMMILWPPVKDKES